MLGASRSIPSTVGTVVALFLRVMQTGTLNCGCEFYFFIFGRNSDPFAYPFITVVSGAYVNGGSSHVWRSGAGIHFTYANSGGRGKTPALDLVLNELASALGLLRGAISAGVIDQADCAVLLYVKTTRRLFCILAHREEERNRNVEGGQAATTHEIVN